MRKLFYSMTLLFSMVYKRLLIVGVSQVETNNLYIYQNLQYWLTVARDKF